jgi:hypothetical protein
MVPVPAVPRSTQFQRKSPPCDSPASKREHTRIHSRPLAVDAEGKQNLITVNSTAFAASVVGFAENFDSSQPAQVLIADLNADQRSKQQHVHPMCVNHVLAGGPLKHSEVPVL